MSIFKKHIVIEGHKYLRCKTAGFPKAIREHPHWLICDRSGKPVPRRGVGDSKTNSELWANFETVSSLVAAEQFLWPYMVLTDDTPFTVFDVDFKPRRELGKNAETEEQYNDRIALANGSLERLRTFFPTRYEARSKSGLGFHIIVVGKFEGTGGKGISEWSQVEIYTRNHGIALTGQATEGNCDIGDYDNDVIQKIRDKIKAERRKSEPVTRNGSDVKKQAPLRKKSEGEIAAMLAAIPTRPPYDEWIKIIAAVGSEVDEETAVRLLQTWSPEEKSGEYLEKLRSGLDQVGIGMRCN